MMAATYSCDWRVDAHAIHGQVGTAYDLANWVECKGFEVLPEGDDINCSLILRPGVEDACERVIGTIKGDDEAVVIIHRDER